VIAVVLATIGLALLVLPGMLGSPRHLPAAEWARVAGISLLLGFATLEIALVLLALPTVLRTLDAVGWASACEHVLPPFGWVGDLLGWPAATIALVIGVRAWRGGSQAHATACATEVEPWLGRHEDRGSFELVVLPTRRLLAVSVPSASQQVLISDGLIERLAADELEAVLLHEATHHRYRHWRYSFLAASVERALLPLGLIERSTSAVRSAVEAWADEAAAGGLTSGRTLMRNALVALADPDASPSTLRTVRERERRLERGPQDNSWPRRIATHVPALSLGAASVIFTSLALESSRASAAIVHCLA
jgi:Zn-dependent protease with chaperone function